MTMQTFLMFNFTDAGRLAAVFAAVKRQPGEEDVNLYSVNITPSALKIAPYLSLLFWTN